MKYGFEKPRNYITIFRAALHYFFLSFQVFLKIHIRIRIGDTGFSPSSPSVFFIKKRLHEYTCNLQKILSLFTNAVISRRESASVLPACPPEFLHRVPAGTFCCQISPLLRSVISISVSWINLWWRLWSVSAAIKSALNGWQRKLPKSRSFRTFSNTWPCCLRSTHCFSMRIAT